MMRIGCALAIACLLLLAEAASVQAQRLGPSGLPLPRFVSIGGGTVNVRTGPGLKYPIRWVFTHRGVPVKIIDESGDWRRIEDVEGETGWVHMNLLKSNRTVLLTGETLRSLRRRPEAGAGVVLRAEPGVMGNLERCEDAWCLIEVGDRKGWLPRDAFWGVLPDEMRR